MSQTKEEILNELEELGYTGIDSLNKPELEKILKTANDAASQKALNEKLNAKLQKSEKQKSKKFPEFKLGKDTYQLIVPSSTLDGKIINENTLSDDCDELKKLVKIKAGTIRKK